MKDRRAKRWSQAWPGGEKAREPVDFVLIAPIHDAISLSDC